MRRWQTHRFIFLQSQEQNELRCMVCRGVDLGQQTMIVSGLVQCVCERVCSTCHKMAISCVARPCGHMYLCWHCGKKANAAVKDGRRRRTCEVCDAQVHKFAKARCLRAITMFLYRLLLLIYLLSLSPSCCCRHVAPL